MLELPTVFWSEAKLTIEKPKIINTAIKTTSTFSILFTFLLRRPQVSCHFASDASNKAHLLNCPASYAEHDFDVTQPHIMASPIPEYSAFSALESFFMFLETLCDTAMTEEATIFPFVSVYFTAT